MQDIPLNLGDTMKTAMLGVCAGGLLRTWTEDGSPPLWSVPEAAFLRRLQGAGVIGRTLRKGQRRGEFVLLMEESGTAVLRSRFPVVEGQRIGQGAFLLSLGDDKVEYEAHVLKLDPAREPEGSITDDVHATLTQAIHYVLTCGESLVVERGGWDAPDEPFCKFMLGAPDGDPAVVITTAPEPRGSAIWAPHIMPGDGYDCMAAPASKAAIDFAPTVMTEAVATWGLQPWDLSLTFVVRR